MATDLMMNPQFVWPLRLMFDTAALVLIWLVQLVIYPAFLHFQRADFKRWHLSYTRRVTYVVMPVMLGQLSLYVSLVFIAPNWDILLNLLLVVVAWAITFFRAIPLHAELDLVADHHQSAERLLRVNGWRTVVWTVVWIVTVLAFLLVV
jgi:hypothetical protein